MKYWFVIIICALSYSSNAQTEEDFRAEWGAAKKIKLDILGFGAQYPSLLLGIEYPLKDNAYAVEHELGPIFSGGEDNRAISKSSGLYTNHTLLLYGKRRGYVIGAGVHFRQLNITGDLTLCASTNADDGGCAYFRLYNEEPLRLQRVAPYFRLRRMTYMKNKVSFSFGVDLGRYFQRVTNDLFDDENFRLETRINGVQIDKKSDIYFRAHAQFIVRI